MREFADHFSRLSSRYAVYRPRYPEGLFDAIAAASPRRGQVWDCATGSGQAAVPLAARFDTVIASDASRQQLRSASPHPRVHYCAALAERSPIRERWADVVTVAQALHWLDLAGFYAEVRRVLRPGGLFVAWTYGAQHVGDAAKYTGASGGTFHFPGFSAEAAEWLLKERNVVGIAVDTLSLDNGPSKDFRVHRLWLPAGRWGLENVANLDKVPAAGATLVVGAPKVKNATGAPTRLIALV